MASALSEITDIHHESDIYMHRRLCVVGILFSLWDRGQSAVVSLM